jgi:hypothetical protein
MTALKSLLNTKMFGARQLKDFVSIGLKDHPDYEVPEDDSVSMAFPVDGSYAFVTLTRKEYREAERTLEEESGKPTTNMEILRYCCVDPDLIITQQRDGLHIVRAQESRYTPA